MLNDYIGILTNPKDTFARIVKQKIALKDSAIRLAISAVLVAVFSFASTWKENGILNPDVGAFVILVLLASIGTFLQTGFAVAVIRFLATWAKGKGTYAENMALFAFIVPLAGIIGVITSLIPTVGFAVNFLWWIYVLYLYIIATSIANKIGMKDAAIVVLAPLAILILILIVVIGPLIVVGALLAASGGLNAIPPMP